MSLKELTKENHSKAERQPFVKVLFSGNIDPKLYATYLYNQFPQYEILEVCAMQHGLFNGLTELPRAKAIYADFMELWDGEKYPPRGFPVAEEYAKYILSIKDDPKKLLAHLYVRHMGDLSGGQMIAKRVPGSGKYYQFDCDVEDLKNRVREKLDDSLAEEARVCFDYATQLFQEMMELVEQQ
jgi:heme oxygenase